MAMEWDTKKKAVAKKPAAKTPYFKTTIHNPGEDPKTLELEAVDLVPENDPVLKPLYGMLGSREFAPYIKYCPVLRGLQSYMVMNKSTLKVEFELQKKRGRI